MLGLVALHVPPSSTTCCAARSSNLVRPMVNGDKPLPAGTPASADGLPQRLLALALLRPVPAWLPGW
jgi:hypothetical protein